MGPKKKGVVSSPICDPPVATVGRRSRRLESSREHLTACRICGSEDVSVVIYNNHLSHKDLKWLAHQAISVLSQLFGGRTGFLRDKILLGQGQRIRLCRDCGYGGLADGSITEEKLKSYYRTRYWQAGGPVESDVTSHIPRDARSEGQINFIAPYLSRNAGLQSLEIGAGAALFSRRLKDLQGAATDVIEIGQGWIPYYVQVGLRHVAEFYPMQESGQYDYIHGSHWLEHVVPEIEERIVVQLRANLKPRGLLFIEVPNCSDDYWTLERRDEPHVHFFTPKSLTDMFTQNGFECLRIGTYGQTNSECFDTVRAGRQGSYHPDLASKIDRSVRMNEERALGSCLRALFRKLG